MTAVELPQAANVRWTAARKLAVVEAVRQGELSLEDACARYVLTVEEFASWRSKADLHGTKGLMATKVRHVHGGPARCASCRGLSDPVGLDGAA